MELTKGPPFFFVAQVGEFPEKMGDKPVNRQDPERNLGGGNSSIFYFHPYLGKWSNLTNIFQMGWNHQLGTYLGLSPPPRMQSSPPGWHYIFRFGDPELNLHLPRLHPGRGDNPKHTPDPNQPFYEGNPSIFVYILGYLGYVPGSRDNWVYP